MNNFTEIKKVFDEIYDNDELEYIINLNPGNYSSNEKLESYGPKTITINGNNQTIDFSLYCDENNLIFNNSILTKYIFAKNLTLHNCTVDSTIEAETIIIDDNCIIKENTLILNEGTVITNKTDIIKYMDTYNGNYTLNNITLSDSRSNYGNLTIINSILNTTLFNYGNLTIINCTMSNIYNDMNFGDPTGLLRNEGGNLIIINSTLTNNSAKLIGYVYVIYNNGNLTITNTTMSNNNISCIYSRIDPKVDITLNFNIDNCIFKNNSRFTVNIIKNTFNRYGTPNLNVTNSLFDNNNKDITVNALNIINI